MKHLSFALILALFLTPGLLFANDASCPREQSLQALEQQADHVVVHEGVDHRFLFYTFDEDWSPGKGDRLEFEIRVNDDIFLVEMIELLPGVKAGDTVELLARDPEQLAQLYDLAKRENNIEIAVRLNGQLVEDFPLEEFIGYNHLLKRDMQMPRSTGSEVKRYHSETETNALPLAIPTKQSCEDECLDEFISCARSCAGVDCDLCDIRYEECLDECNPSCTPKTETVIEEDLVGINPVGSYQCFLVPPFYNWSAWFVWSRATYKYTEKRITTHSDCTVSVTVIRVWYEYYYCWSLHYNAPCSPAAPLTGPRCF